MIDDRHTFLERLKSIGREYSTNIICFNADMLAGRVHAELAVRLARRSWMGESAIANTFEMEALLYAAGSRQCNVASRFGINDGENHLFICCNPGGNERVWAALSPFLEYVDTERFEITDQNKRERLIDLFSITPLELGSLDTGTTITDLILERVALLQVLR
jgi:KEOPS complex subunit Cgi121